MFIRVTNCAQNHKGDPLLININSIVSVYERHEPGGSLLTIIWSSDRVCWEVEESIERVHTLIKESVQK